MHTLNLKFFLLGLAVLSAFAGCASNTPVLDQHFGDAVNAAKAQQIMNPEASQNTDPVAGIDGDAANATVDRYHKSFEQPPATTNIFNIGVGTGGGSTGATVR